MGRKKSPKKPRKVNVDTPGFEDFTLPPGAPPESQEALAFLQRLYMDPESASNDAVALLMEAMQQLAQDKEAEIPAKDRREAKAVGARSWVLFKARNYEAAFSTAREALQRNPWEPVAAVVAAAIEYPPGHDTFEAAAAATLDIDMELSKSPGGARRKLLEEVGYVARYLAGLSAFVVKRYESAPGPLEEALELHPEDEHGAKFVLLAAYLALGEVDLALDVMADHCDASSPFALWALVLARLMVKSGPGARLAFEEAMGAAPHVLPWLTGELVMTDRLYNQTNDKLGFSRDHHALWLLARVMKRRRSLGGKLKALAQG